MSAWAGDGRTPSDADRIHTGSTGIAVIRARTIRPFDTAALVADPSAWTIGIVTAAILAFAVDTRALIKTIDGCIADICLFT